MASVRGRLSRRDPEDPCATIARPRAGLFSTPSASRFKRKERPTKSQEPPLRRILRGPLIYLLLVLAVLWIFLSFATRGHQSKLLSIREFVKSELDGGEV